MKFTSLSPENRKQAERVLGYLNFSTGSYDPKFFRDLDDLFYDLNILNQAQHNRETSFIEQGAAMSGESKQAFANLVNSSQTVPTYQLLYEILKDGLEYLQQETTTFKNNAQALGALCFTFDHVLPAYKEFHKDLLYHQTEDFLFTSFFIARTLQYVLQTEAPWDDFKQADIIHRLNDYVGYRPTAVLHNRQKMQPYAHEFFQPIPLYIEGVGIWKGPYYDVCKIALDILHKTDESILTRAYFDPDKMRELAIDVRTMDFDHPVNRRLNYPFGSWDASSVDNKGYFRRYIIHQTTLDAICSRTLNSNLPYDELVYEAGAVLAGTMLMGASINGSSPDSHDSSVTLSTLLLIVAQYRDEFYESLMEKSPEPIRSRLIEEIKTYRQPFGSARQYFNHILSKLRAEQLQNVQLARLYAWMGYPDAAQDRAALVKSVSARMRCQIDCLITNAHSLLDDDQVDEVVPLIKQIETILEDGIQCGAFVDPWNILGFGGQFPLFQSAEDSTPDQRVDELINLMGAIFNLYARAMRQAAVFNKGSLKEKLSSYMHRLTNWWDQYASSELSSIDSISGEESWESANQVADALAVWKKAGAAAGDIKFWRPQVENFDSTKAYALLIEELMDQNDYVAAMALLMNWLSASDEILLDDGDYTVHPLILRWMEEQWYKTTKIDRIEGRRGKETMDGWSAAKKFIDFLEANAGAYWEIPHLEVSQNKFPSFDEFKQGLKDDAVDNDNFDDLFLNFMGMPKPPAEGDDPDDFNPLDENEEDEGYDEDEEDDDDNLFRSAYENVIYHDTTDDGVDSDMMDDKSADPLGDFELTDEMERISDRLLFWVTVARLWKMSAVFSLNYAGDHPDRDETLQSWAEIGREKLLQLLYLANEVERFKISAPSDSRQSMIEYEQRRAIKDSLLERLMSTIVEMEDVCRILAATQTAPIPAKDNSWETLNQRILQAVLHSDVEQIHNLWQPFLDVLSEQTLLYRPISRGGSAQKIAKSKGVQTVIQRLLYTLPKLGLMLYSVDLIKISQKIEHTHPIGMGAITRFDKIFEVACFGMVRNIIEISSSRRPNWSVKSLTETLEKLAEALLLTWLPHANGIRVSSIEPILGSDQWLRCQSFIKKYGKDFFSPIHMGYGELQAILHQTVPVWLHSLMKSDDPEVGEKLLEDLNNNKISFEEACHWLDLIYDTVMEYFGQYIDYNSTTTQSDKGEMLYTLLDFLRLQASYDRIVWKLMPVSTIHSVLVHEGKMKAADYWLQAIAERLNDEADSQWERYVQLQKQYGMIMSAIGDRIGERFVKPLEVEQLCSLIEPAINEKREKKPLVSFKAFSDGVALFAQTPRGNGFELPAWLEAVEKEAQRIRNRSEEEDEMIDLSAYVKPVMQTKEKLMRTIAEMKNRIS